MSELPLHMYREFSKLRTLFLGAEDEQCLWGGRAILGIALQGHLAHKKMHPPS